MKNLAPIVLFTYNRLDHTRQTVEALRKNILASESELFVYSDMAKNQDSIEEVIALRKYLKTIIGFKNITIIERDKNWGLANSVIDGVTEIINKYDKVIVLEDDILTSPYFLKFMNEALDFYQNEENIISISGYTFPFDIPMKYNKAVHVLYRGSSWGWATWGNRWRDIDWFIKDYKIFIHSKKQQKLFKRAGSDVVNMLASQMNGKIDSWAIRFLYHHHKKKGLCLFNNVSLAKNIGHDSSGVHCRTSSKWNIETLATNGSFRFYKPIFPNSAIHKKFIQYINTVFFMKIYYKLMFYIKRS